MVKKKQVAEEGSMEEPEMDIKKIMKEIEHLGSSRMTWKERKELENKKIVSLGGKPTKKQRLPLSVARPQMKNQKKREQKMLEESLILGRFERKRGGGSRSRRTGERRMPEDRVLKASEGHFRNGVLDVKHLLHSGPSRNNESSSYMGKGKMGKDGGKNKGGKNGKGKRRH